MSHHKSPLLPATAAIDAKTATIQRRIGAAVMRAVNAKEPMSDPRRLRVIAHASLNVRFLPTVSWETVAASRPVRMLVPANVESHCTMVDIICMRRTLASSVVDCWSAWGSLPALVADSYPMPESRIDTLAMSDTNSMMTMVKPKRTFGLERIAAKAPLNRSPIVRGRKGMMPGWACHPHRFVVE